MPKHQLIGQITSNKMEKTVVVEVEKMKVHPKYKRRYKYHKHYKAHAEGGDYRIGDRVLIEECRPLSRDKRWKVIKKINAAAGKEGQAEELVLEEGVEEQAEKAENIKKNN